MTEASPPLVSVVIATYNRADILPYAIRSALLNDGMDVEVIVVGDGCTDDTAAAVSGIADGRVRYVNLPHNWGEQSVPSNEGIALARGKFVAFLNHDDLYLPWHLSDLMTVHRETGADVTWSPYAVGLLAQNGPNGVRPVYELAGVTPALEFDPRVFIVASACCYRKSVLERIGGWTPASQTILSPSQDLLFKAYRAGFRMCRSDVPSVLALYSGERKDSYTRPSEAEHRWFFELVQDRERLFNELIRAGVHEAAKIHRMLDRTSVAFFGLWRLQRRFSSLATRFGIHPTALRMWLRHRTRGGFINRVRRSAGLPAVDFRAREKERGKFS